MSEDKTPSAEAGDKEQSKSQVPGQGQPDQTKKEDQAPLQNIPEKFKGKSAEDVVKMYSELEKKYGQHSDEVSKARQYLQEREILSKAVAQNPELYKMLEKEINSIYGKDTVDQSKVSKEGGEEAGKADPQVADLRRVEQNRIIAEFEYKFGLDKLPKSERKEMMEKVGTQLAELYDPGGAKPIAQVLSSVKIDQLGKILENSYWLANKDSLMDKGKLPVQDLASIGSMSTSSSTGKSGPSLTERERQTAQRLGVDPDKYLKQKVRSLESQI